MLEAHSWFASESGWSDSKLGSSDYRRLARYVERVSGIRMPDTRLTMLEGRLRQRLRLLGLPDFTSYCRLALENGGDPAELAHLVDRATTNTTEFFREAAHFEYLRSTVIPGLRVELAEAREVSVWSAGCSSGEEPYTLAMVFAEAQAAGQGARHRILATDISRDMLATAARAVYPVERIGNIPKPLRQKYLLSSRDSSRSTVRIAPALRHVVSFRHLNLMDEDFALEAEMDVIFCRNVFIYFDRLTQHRVLLRLAQSLAPGGYLFVGHTDTIHGLGIPLVPVAPAIYRRPW